MVVAKVEARDVPVEVRAPVDLRPLAQADVGSKTLGYLDAVLVDRGDRVKRGQLLALVRPSDLPDQLAAARGSARADAGVARRSRAPTSSAPSSSRPSGVVSQQELQQAQAALAAAEAAEAAAKAQIGALGGAPRRDAHRVAARRRGLAAPARSRARSSARRAAAPSSPWRAIDVLRVFVTVNEREVAARAASGQDAHVEVDALPGRAFEGKVVRLAPALDPATRTLDAEVQLANRAGELRPGMYGRGAIVARDPPAARRSSRRRAVQISDGQALRLRARGRQGRSGARSRPASTAATGSRSRRASRAGEEVVIAGADGALRRRARCASRATSTRSAGTADAAPAARRRRAPAAH